MLVKINFLPYREQNQKNKEDKFKHILLLTALAAAGAVFLWGYVFDYRVEKQQQRNEFLTQEIQKLDQQLVEVKTLEKEIKELMQQRDTVYKLQNNRAYALEWLEMLVRRTPQELYLTKIEQNEGTYTISGIATNNDRVSQFMTQLDQVEWVRNTRLQQSQAKVTEEEAPMTGEKIQRTLYEFTISFDRKVPDDLLQSSIDPNNPNNDPTLTGDSASGVQTEPANPSNPASSAGSSNGGGYGGGNNSGASSPNITPASPPSPASGSGNLDLSSKSMGVKP